MIAHKVLVRLSQANETNKVPAWCRDLHVQVWFWLIIDLLLTSINGWVNITMAPCSSDCWVLQVPWLSLYHFPTQSMAPQPDSHCSIMIGKILLHWGCIYTKSKTGITSQYETNMMQNSVCVCVRACMRACVSLHIYLILIPCQNTLLKL